VQGLPAADSIHVAATQGAAAQAPPRQDIRDGRKARPVRKFHLRPRRGAVAALASMRPRWQDVVALARVRASPPVSPRLRECGQTTPVVLTLARMRPSRAGPQFHTSPHRPWAAARREHPRASRLQQTPQGHRAPTRNTPSRHACWLHSPARCRELRMGSMWGRMHPEAAARPGIRLRQHVLRSTPTGVGRCSPGGYDAHRDWIWPASLSATAARVPAVVAARIASGCDRIGAAHRAGRVCAIRGSHGGFPTPVTRPDPHSAA
jgi:hypothetical protein